MKQRFNGILALNRVGYRIGPEDLITTITDEVELQSIDDAANGAQGAAREHMRRAVKLFADRDIPQFAKSISESILAAEGAAKELAASKPSAALGDAVDELRRKGVVHPALAEGWKKLYGYTSQDGGIRHAMSEEMPDPTQELAQYSWSFIQHCESVCGAWGRRRSTGFLGGW